MSFGYFLPVIRVSMFDDGTSTLVFVKYELGELIKKKKRKDENRADASTSLPSTFTFSLLLHVCVCVYVFSL